MDASSNTVSNEPPKSCAVGCEGASWWATLIVAVLAVPAFGIIVSIMSGQKGFFAVAIFIVACWFCTYLGMKLMQNPKMSEKIDLNKNQQ